MEAQIDAQSFDEQFADFIDRAERYADGKPFTGFDHPMVDPWESYKKEVHTDARAKLLSKTWRPEDIASGLVHQRVDDALMAEVVHREQLIKNNLVDWRARDDYKMHPRAQAVDQVIYDLFKDKRKPGTCFDELLAFDLPVDFISYLFFLKDRNQFLPMRPSAFDHAFKLLGVSEFQLSGNASWSTYLVFIDLIKQVQSLLKTKLSTPVDLLDAHSFVWTIGHTFPKWDNEPEDGEDTDEEKDQEPPPQSGATAPAEGPLPSTPVTVQPEFEADLFPEGKERYILHKKAERNAALVAEAKAKFLEGDPNMCCEVCGYSFFLTFGEAGAGYIEAHHTVPVSTMQPGHLSRLEDLAMVCSNCHVMLHRINPLPSVSELRQRLRGSTTGTIN